MRMWQKIVGLALLTLILSACEDEQRAAIDIEFMQKAVQEISTMRAVSPSEWRKEDRDVLEKYFKTLAFWIQSAEKGGDPQGLPSGVSCRTLFVEPSKWKELSQNCQRGVFYLCPDEMRNYESLLSRTATMLAECKGIF